MIEDVTKRLAFFGYALPESDSWIVEFIIDKITNEISNNTNQTTLPKALHETAVDMIVAEFLLAKKGAGTLEIESIDLSVVEKSIQEGDTTVVFAIGEGSQTPEQRFDLCMGLLRNLEGRGFTTHRRFKW